MSPHSRLNGVPPSELSKGEGHPKPKHVHVVDSEESSAEQQLQEQLKQLQQEFADYRNQKSLRDPPTPKPKHNAQAQAYPPPAQTPSESSRQGATAGQVRGQGRGRGRDRVQCSNCNKFGHRDKDCTRPPWYFPPPQAGGGEMHIKSIRGSNSKGFTQASFRERLVPCTLDTSIRRNVIDPALVHQARVEPFEEDDLLQGQLNPAAVGQYCAVFRIEQQLVTTVVDVVPGAEGLTLGSDWLNNNVSQWNLNTGKVNTYDGLFQTKVERNVHMIRT